MRTQRGTDAKPLSKPTAEYFYQSQSPINEEFEKGQALKDVPICPEAAMMMPELVGFDWVTIWKGDDGQVHGIRAVGGPGDPIEVEH